MSSENVTWHCCWVPDGVLVHVSLGWEAAHSLSCPGNNSLMGMTNLQKDGHKEFSFELSTAVVAKGKKRKRKTCQERRKKVHAEGEIAKCGYLSRQVWIYASTDLGISSSVGNGIFPTGNRQPQESPHGNLLSCAWSSCFYAEFQYFYQELCAVPFPHNLSQAKRPSTAGSLYYRMPLLMLMGFGTFCIILMLHPGQGVAWILTNAKSADRH